MDSCVPEVSTSYVILGEKCKVISNSTLQEETACCLLQRWVGNKKGVTHVCLVPSGPFTFVSIRQTLSPPIFSQYHGMKGSFQGSEPCDYRASIYR